MKARNLAKAVKMYQLQWLFKDRPQPQLKPQSDSQSESQSDSPSEPLSELQSDPLSERLLEYNLEHGVHYILGELDSHVVVSFPPSILSDQAGVLCHELSEKLDKPVLPVTHNVAFVKAVRLDKNECTKVLERIHEQRKAN